MPGPFAVTLATKVDPSVIYPMKPSPDAQYISKRTYPSDKSAQSYDPTHPRKSKLGWAFEKTKSKLNRRPSNAETLPDDEKDFERRKAHEVKNEKRKADYERLGLDKEIRFGNPGAGGWGA